MGSHSDRKAPSGNYFKTSGGTDDDRLHPAEQNLEAFFFNRGMKPADNAAAFISPPSGLVHGFKDGIAGAAYRGEKRCFGDTEQIQAADCP